MKQRVPPAPGTASRAYCAPVAALLISFTVLVGDPAIGFSASRNVEKSEQATFRITTLTNQLSHPWALAFLPNGDMLVTERPGRLRILRNGVLDPKPIAGLPKIAAGGQGGLLDIALHPNFASNRLIYFSYAARGKGGRGTEVAHARFDGKRFADVKVIFRAKPKTRSQVHFGSRLLFAPDGFLYITLGEKGDMRHAQHLSTHPGSVIRLRDDGSVPEDNPFVAQERAVPEIYSYGHRNVQGMALRPGTRQIWTHEHGPRGGDEVNILKLGANYGWPKITYGIDYNGAIISSRSAAPGMEQPVIYWIPSIAPSGMAFYSGDKFPQWKGDLFVGALAGAHLRRLELKGDKVVAQEMLLEGLGERIRDVRAGPDGYLYVLTDSRRGRLLRLEP